MDSLHEVEESAMPKLIYLRNCPFPAVRFDREKIENAMDYEAKDGDIILCTYPKTGTTWTQYIIWAILNKAEHLPRFEDMTFKYFPFMEWAGIDMINTLPSPRTYKHHLPYHLMKVNKNAKYVYVYRNPVDTVVSYYHFNLDFYEGAFTFDEFFEGFISGKIGFGDFFDHVLSYDVHKNEPYLLMLSYEDLKKDTREQILKLAGFLGEEYYRTLIDDEARLQKILEITSFSHMKEHLDMTMSAPDKKSKKEHIAILRKGVVGDGESILSSEQKKRLHQKMLTKMKGTRYIQLWSTAQCLMNA